jgi:hypothetical protein
VVTMKNAVFLDVMLCGSCKNQRFRELSASIIRVPRIYIALKRQFLQEPHGVTSQKMAFFINMPVSPNEVYHCKHICQVASKWHIITHISIMRTGL